MGESQGHFAELMAELTTLKTMLDATKDQLGALIGENAALTMANELKAKTMREAAESLEMLENDCVSYTANGADFRFHVGTQAGLIRAKLRGEAGEDAGPFKTQG